MVLVWQHQLIWKLVRNENICLPLLLWKLREWGPTVCFQEPYRWVLLCIQSGNCCSGVMILRCFPLSHRLQGFEPQSFKVVTWALTYILLTFLPSLSHFPHFLICTLYHLPNKLQYPSPFLRAFFGDIINSGNKPPSAEVLTCVRYFTYIISFNSYR